MPVRSLRSSIIKWPDRETVQQALRSWVRELRREHPEVLKIGVFGSYARGDWGGGSDLDLIVVIRGSDLPRERRALPYDPERLPVPADLLIYTLEEWSALSASGSRFARTIAQEAIWV